MAAESGSVRVVLLHALALLRIGVGIFFAKEALTKIAAGWLWGGDAFAKTVRAYPSAHGTGAYHAIVTELILPHAALFAFLVTIGECTVTISLVLGFMTRLGALVALWLNVNFMLLRGIFNPGGTIDKAFIVCEILFIVFAAGQVWGLDGVLSERVAGNRFLRTLTGPSPA